MSAEVSFASTTIRTEVTRWYEVMNAPIMEFPLDGARGHMRRFSPSSVRFTFVDGGCTALALSANTVRLDGEISERVMAIPEINMHDKRNWPKWLHELYQLAESDFSADQRVLV